jgi:hypothetical protein
MGTLLTLFGSSITVARTICEITVAIGVSVFSFLFRRVTQSPVLGASITFVLVTPPVILAANMVRMEAPIFLLFGLAMLLHTHRKFLAATSLLMLSLLFHPALALASSAYVATVGLVWGANRRSMRPLGNRVEWLLLGLVLVAISFELVWVANHLTLFRAHMEYQAVRKLSRHTGQLLMKPQGIFMFAELTVTIGMLIALKRKAQQIDRLMLIPIAAATLGMQIYAVIGGEMAYDVYSLSASPAIFICLAYRSIRSEMDALAEHGAHLFNKTEHVMHTR